MTTNQPTTLAECVPILVAAGCPEPPEWVDTLNEQIQGMTRSGYMGPHLDWVDNPEAVNAALQSWVMGVVVPWAENQHGVEIGSSRVRTVDMEKAYRFTVNYSIITETDYSAAVVALTVAICGVVGEVKA